MVTCRPYNDRMSKSKSQQTSGGTIALNRKAKHDYFIQDRYEAGLVLQGWEVKSLRAGKCQLVDSYVLIKGGEAFLLGALITPLQSAATHFVTDPTRTRKLLLKDREIFEIGTAIQQKGYTCVCTAIYWKRHLVKCEVSLAKGKAEHDKREVEKQKDWDRERQRLLAAR
jgi:SsrA-binding protein